MSFESDFPVAVVDAETAEPVVVTRWQTVEQAESFIGYLAEHSGAAGYAKVMRGGYAVDAPTGCAAYWPGREKQ